VAGSKTLAVYSLACVLGTGSAILGIFGLAFVYKITHLVSVLICPVSILRCKKRYHNKQLDFSHYQDEFDFMIGEEPNCYPEVLAQDKK